MEPLDAQKLALRDQLNTGRRRRGMVRVSQAALAFAELIIEIPEVRRASTVAAYVSVGAEPGTGPLLDRLQLAGKRVILPVLLPDNDLDWAPYDGPDALVAATRGLLEPTGERLGPDAIATADVVVTPGLAVDGLGRRLGRGGGSYDRALARVPVGTFVVTLLYATEVLGSVPYGPHDREVTAALTPDGLRRFRPAAG
ncbi:MAG: 5-formyltetrahydrofolate cyclo-ligase [Nocardioidaceae bacterium]